jgi:hypothetical protein
MNELDNDEFVELLKDVFPIQAFQPDERARGRLRDALAHDNVVPLAATTSRSTRVRRRIGSHATALTLSVIGVVTFGGVAAAAVATNTLPGPIRALVYDLGLPVTSPALYQARQQLHQLDSAITHHHTSAVHQLGRGLLHDLALLNHGDLSQIRTPAQKALTQSGLLAQSLKILGIATHSTTTTEAPSSSSSTTTTTVLVPPIVPGVGSIAGTSGSSGVGGTLKNTSSSVNSLLP